MAYVMFLSRDPNLSSPSLAQCSQAVRAEWRFHENVATVLRSYRSRKICITGRICITQSFTGGYAIELRAERSFPYLESLGHPRPHGR